MILIVYLHSFTTPNNILCTVLYNHVYTSYMYIGISFAIPIDTAAQVIKQLKRHKKVIRPYIGINAYSLYIPYMCVYYTTLYYLYTKYIRAYLLYRIEVDTYIYISILIPTLTVLLIAYIYCIYVKVIHY